MRISDVIRTIERIENILGRERLIRLTDLSDLDREVSDIDYFVNDELMKSIKSSMQIGSFPIISSIHYNYNAFSCVIEIENCKYLRMDFSTDFRRKNWILISKKQIEKQWLSDELISNYREVKKSIKIGGDVPTKSLGGGWIVNRIHRTIAPSGKWVVILGPDGVGKTTTIIRMLEYTKFIYKDSIGYHLYPSKNRQLKQHPLTTQLPFERQSRNYILSLIMVNLWFIRYLLSHFLITMPNTIKGNFVIIDRGFLDLIISPSRYRINPKLKDLILFMYKLLPAPTVIYVLEDDPKKIHSRKSELSESDIHKWYADVRSLVNNINVKFMQVGENADETARKVLDDIKYE